MDRSWVPPRTVPVPWERHFASLCGLFFVQIGANCGTDHCGEGGLTKGGEPVWAYQKRFAWRGAAVEANPQTAQLLQRNYQNYTEVATINVAVSNESGSMDLWCPKGKTSWNYLGATSETCTSSRHWAMRSDWKDRHHYITQVITLPELWAKLQPEAVDLLVVDVEGAESRILASGPLPTPKPRMIFFESTSFHVDVDGIGADALTQRAASVHASLRGQGYTRVAIDGGSQTESELWSNSSKLNLHDELWRHESMVELNAGTRGWGERRGVRAEARNALLFAQHNSSSPCAVR